MTAMRWLGLGVVAVGWVLLLYLAFGGVWRAWVWLATWRASRRGMRQIDSYLAKRWWA